MHVLTVQQLHDPAPSQRWAHKTGHEVACDSAPQRLAKELLQDAGQCHLLRAEGWHHSKGADKLHEA